jgi:hypothetical protein
LLPEHWVALGVHTGDAAHEQAPHPQLAEQDSVPYVLHACFAPGLQTP